MLFTNNVKAARSAGTSLLPAHLLTTNYRYNSLNQVVAQNTPDAQTSKFWYDKLGRLVVSQNAKQSGLAVYSYTQYDPLGRITEVGQKPQTSAITQAISQDATLLSGWLAAGGLNKTQLTRTIYDLSYNNGDNTLGQGTVPILLQTNLRNRVSYTLLFDVEPAVTAVGTHQAGTFYSYDIHGNVNVLLQDINQGLMQTSGNRFKTINYNYDLISGKVNMVKYQDGKPDAFYHQYTYDAENRLTSVVTSRDQIIMERDAAFTYYKHGTLARTELGQMRVQGTDYAYTLQGWLKGINSTSATAVNDLGNDGGTGANTTAKDVVGLALHYYDDATYQDYKAIGGVSAFSRPGAGAGISSLYNGNIAAISINNTGLPAATAGINAAPLLYNYRYDQLNRLVSMQAYNGLNTATNIWSPVAISDYQEAVSYDPNGNIITYNRKGAPSAGLPLEMDNLAYTYKPATNQLDDVNDLTVPAANYPNDIDTQAAGNYSYDAIGNLIKDNSTGSDNITNINWSVYGKIQDISKPTGNISYTYDAGGNRITKTAAGIITAYIRDASGNVMSVYTSNGSNMVQQESHLYGSSRLGIAGQQTIANQTILLASGFGNATLATFVRGLKSFEITNHLGNVLATVSDKKLGHTSNNSSIDYYNPDVSSAQDYYPFGMQMPGRKFSSLGYRYGFNGQEESDDVTIGNTTAEYWEYDSRIGRRWNLDPVPMADASDYSTFGNNPISNVDPDGAYFFGWFGSTSAQRKGAKAFAKETGGEVNNIMSKNVNVTFSFGSSMENSGVGKTNFYDDGFAKISGKSAHLDFQNQSFDRKNGGVLDHTTGRYAPGMASGRVEMSDDPFTSFGPGLIRGLVGKLAVTATIAGEKTLEASALTDLELVTKAATKAENAIGGTGRFAGSAKHTYANKLLSRYQSIYGSRGLEFNQYFNKVTGKGFLDVINHRTMSIYDFKFGKAVMNNAQYLKYSSSFPGYSIQIIKP